MDEIFDIQELMELVNEFIFKSPQPMLSLIGSHTFLPLITAIASSGFLKPTIPSGTNMKKRGGGIHLYHRRELKINLLSMYKS